MVKQNLNIQVNYSCNQLNSSMKIIFDILTPRPHFIIIQREKYRKTSATENEIKEHSELIDFVKHICGRLILNGVPTGVEVCLSMQHGGPFPATTDSRFTSVGADGIKRFARPICYQNWSNELLPDELKNENPLGMWRTVNDQLRKDPLS